MAIAPILNIMRRRDSLSAAIRRWHRDVSAIRLYGHCRRHPKWPLIDGGRCDHVSAVLPAGDDFPRGAA